MAFMKRQVIQCDWYKCETTVGTEFVLADIIHRDDESADRLSKYTEGEVSDYEVLRGWFGARLSAPGYMDRTEWCCFKTEAEAIKYLDEMYPEEDQ